MRVLVLRSSRYLDLALRQTADRWPQAGLAIVAPPNTYAGPTKWPVFAFAGRAFSPWNWWRSAARRQVRAWRPNEVVIQLPGASTYGSVNLGLTALLISPRGFWFVRPDGQLQFMPASRWLGELAFRAGRPAIIGAAMVLVAAGTLIATAPGVNAMRSSRTTRDGRAIGAMRS
jgi:hypothetical protein